MDNLVDSSTQIVEAIWPLSSVVCRSELGSKAVLPLRTFIQETLRRSRTSYSTLQVALYYLVLIKPHVPMHNFTMEQPEDRHSDRALQCGRRMFLAALILASKYLQDRNYSARAWSKISGLNTQEINQNEMAFLMAVDWKLHIAEDVFQRWTDIVLKYTPPPTPPSPGGAALIAAQVADWKQLVLSLNTDLTNVDGLVGSKGNPCDLSALSPRSILNMPESRDVPSPTSQSRETTPLARSYATPVLMEPTPTTVFSSSRVAPSLGRLPTPRLTPQPSGWCTPAASAASNMLGKSSAMGLAMSQSNAVSAAQCLDRLPTSGPSSPQPYCPARRSSLATSVSTASSPESMVSDSSRSSRSSSISSASSLAGATFNSKLTLPSRSRGLKQSGDKSSNRPAITSVPEDYDESCFSSSPESYTGPIGRLEDISMASHTPLVRRERDLEGTPRDAASDAARALQDLHSQPSSGRLETHRPKAGSKRSRPLSIDNSLQENVREILGGRGDAAWPDTLIRSRAYVSESNIRIPMRPSLPGSQKRVCCSAEAANGYELAAQRSLSYTGPGMWDGILN